MPVAGAHQPGLAHQPRDPFAAVSFTAVAQIGMHARRAIGLAGNGVHRPHAGKQRRVGLRMSGWRPVPPSMEARLGDAELHAQLLVLTPGPRQFVTFDSAQAGWRIRLSALFLVCSRNPVADGLGGWLELRREIVRVATSANQFDHLTANSGK